MYYRELFWGNGYLWEHHREITSAFHIGLFQKLSQHREMMDIVVLILPVQVLRYKQNKYCLNLSIIWVEEEEMTAATFCSLQGWV